MQSPLFTPEFLLLTGPVWLQISLLWPAVLSEAFLAIPTPLDKDGLFCLGWCRKGHKKKIIRGGFLVEERAPTGDRNLQIQSFIIFGPFETLCDPLG